MTGNPANPLPPGLLRRLALVWLVLALITLAVAAGRIAEMNLRGDDALRLVQVRDLVAGQGWFDLHQYRIDPPHGVPMHWSRLVDAPIALVLVLLTPLLGSGPAEALAVVIVPLATLAIVLFAIGIAAGRLFDTRIAVFAALCVGLFSPVLFQLQPTLIDHHGWQVAALAIALNGLVARRALHGGALAGAALGFGLTISLEVLPVAAVFAGVLALRWLRSAREGVRLAAFLGALAATLAVLFFITLGPANAITRCDAIGPAHLGFFGLVAIGAALAVKSGRSGPVFVIGVLALSGFVALAGFGMMVPECLGTPFGSLDPLVRDYWYLNVGEGRPIWVQDPALAFPSLVQLVLALVACALLLRSTNGEKRLFWLDYTLLLVGTTVAGLLVWRSMAFAGVVAAIPLGWLAATALARIETLRALPVKVAALAVLAVGLMPATLVQAATLLAPPAEAGPGMTDVQSGGVVDSSCREPAVLARLAALPGGVVFTHFDIGPAILMRTPHAVVATGHHRAEKAMHDTIAGMLSPPQEAERIIRARAADYVVLCKDMNETALFAGARPDGLAAKLVAGQKPAWLEEMPGFGSSALGVWRVRPEGNAGPRR